MKKFNVKVTYSQEGVSHFNSILARNREDAEEIANIRFKETYTNTCKLTSIEAKEI